MSLGLWILAAMVLGVAVIGIVQFRAARGVYRPLASRQPQGRREQTPELGLEAIDMNVVRRTQRSNESLERSHTLWTGQRGITGAIDTNVQPMADDETYAKRFYTAYMKNKD